MESADFNRRMRQVRDRNGPFRKSALTRRETATIRARKAYETLEGSDLLELMAAVAMNPKIGKVRICFHQESDDEDTGAQLAFLQDDMKRIGFTPYGVQLNHASNYLEISLYDFWETLMLIEGGEVELNRI